MKVMLIEPPSSNKYMDKLFLNDLKIDFYGSFVVDPSFTRQDFKDLAFYIRRLKPTYFSTAILTPLPGTELYAERLNELTSGKPEFFDLTHAILPTTLPLKEFYEEYIKLWSKSTTLFRSLKLIGKYGRCRWLSTIRERNDIFKKFKHDIFSSIN